MHARLEFTDRQAERVLCAIEMYLEQADGRVTPKGLRALLAAKRKVERAREDILTKRIRAGLRP